jgi:hypothetical protein
MLNLFYYIPFGYFVKTRLNTKAAILFHGYAEFLLGLILLCYFAEPNIPIAITKFFAAYIAFIAFYEIGYIYNDFISVKFEENPRERLGAYKPSNTILLVWVVLRLVVFTLLCWYLNVFNSLAWWGFYGLLMLSFLAHNILKQKQNKIFTFFCLAFFRFYAPIFIYLKQEQFVQTLPAIIIFYVFFRTITYMDSKNLLQIPNRGSVNFKINYYIYLAPLALAISVITNNWIISIINVYFFIFWVAIAVVFKGINKNNIS